MFSEEEGEEIFGKASGDGYKNKNERDDVGKVIHQEKEQGMQKVFFGFDHVEEGREINLSRAGKLGKRNDEGKRDRCGVKSVSPEVFPDMLMNPFFTG